MKAVEKKPGERPKWVDGVKVVSSGVKRIVELQEKGYMSIRPDVLDVILGQADRTLAVLAGPRGTTLPSNPVRPVSFGLAPNSRG